jgi:hypothetical protein
MPTTFKLYADKMGATDPATYIGRDGDLFYDPDSGALKRSDGTTPGGIAITGGSGIQELVQDIGPELGGDLTISGNQIVGDLIPSDNVTYDLGSSSNRWRDLYLSGNTIDLGGVPISSSVGKIDLPNGSTVGGQTIFLGTPTLEAVVLENPATVQEADFRGGLKTDLINSSGPGPIQANNNVNVVGTLSATVSIDAPVGSMSADSGQFTTINVPSLINTTTISGHNIPAGTGGTYALTSDIPTLPAEDFMDIAPTTTSFDSGAGVFTNGSFVQTQEGTPQDIEVSCTVTSGFTNCKVEISMAGWDHTDGTREYYLELCRIVNGGTPTVLKELLFPNPNDHFVPVNFMHVDTHGASAGDTVAYKLRAKSTASTSFRLVTGISGDSIYLKELA